LRPVTDPVIASAGFTVSANVLGLIEIAAVAPVTLVAGIVNGNVRVEVVAAVGAPVIVILTSVLLKRVAVPADSPTGSPLLIAKFIGVIAAA